MTDYLIPVDSREHGEYLQRRCFTKGYEWMSGGQRLHNYPNEREVLIISSRIGKMSVMQAYEDREGYTEISIDDLPNNPLTMSDHGDYRRFWQLIDRTNARVFGPIYEENRIMGRSRRDRRYFVATLLDTVICEDTPTNVGEQQEEVS